MTYYNLIKLAEEKEQSSGPSAKGVIGSSLAGAFALSPERLRRKRNLEYQGRAQDDIKKALARRRLELKAQSAVTH